MPFYKQSIAIDIAGLSAQQMDELLNTDSINDFLSRYPETPTFTVDEVSMTSGEADEIQHYLLNVN